MVILGDGEVAEEEDQVETILHHRTITIRSLRQEAHVLRLVQEHGDLGSGQARWEEQLLVTWPATDLSSRGTKGCGAIRVGFGITTILGRAAQVGEEELGLLALLRRPSRPPDMRVPASARRAEDESMTRSLQLGFWERTRYMNDDIRNRHKARLDQ